MALELADAATLAARAAFGAVGAILAVTILKRTPLPTFGFQYVAEAEERKREVEEKLRGHRKERDALQDELRGPLPADMAEAAEVRARRELLAKTLEHDIDVDSKRLSELGAVLRKHQVVSYIAGFAVYIVGGVAFAMLLTGIVVVQMPAGIPPDAGSALVIGATWPAFLGAFRFRQAYEGAQQDFERTIEKLQKDIEAARENAAKRAAEVVPSVPGPGAMGEPGVPVPVLAPLDVFAETKRSLEREREKTRRSMEQRVRAA